MDKQQAVYSFLSFQENGLKPPGLPESENGRREKVEEENKWQKRKMKWTKEKKKSNSLPPTPVVDINTMHHPMKLH
jgi:hypothetical protein